MIWYGMNDRCHSTAQTPRAKEQCKNYRDRGISVCEEWRHSYEAFKEWSLANGYRDDLTIDRIDIDKDYSPENCKWSTLQEQSKNRSNCYWFEVEPGKKIKNGGGFRVFRISSPSQGCLYENKKRLGPYKSPIYPLH
jgi:hypothetical protein